MKKILFLLLLSATIFSCRVTLNPKSSPASIANVIDLQNSSNGLFDGVINGDKTFATHAPDYVSLQSKIDSMVAYNSIRPKAPTIYRQSILVQQAFNNLLSEHQRKGKLSTDEARSDKSVMKSYLKPLLVSELSLKK